MIAAGSTGSIPATAALLATIARLPHGAVVLPGLDTDLDEATWAMLADEQRRRARPSAIRHAALLKRIGIARDDVRPLAQPRRTAASASSPKRCARPPPANCGRNVWRTEPSPRTPTRRCKPIAVIEAANAEEEALAIAVALREAVETPGKTAALVTPDRALGRRVLGADGALERAGRRFRGLSLADTPAGVFARLALEAALGGLAPVPLLALLKHPSVPIRCDAASRRWSARSCAVRGQSPAPPGSPTR